MAAGRMPARRDDGTARTAAVERVPDPVSLNLDAIWDAEWQRNLFAAALERVKAQVSARLFQIFELAHGSGVDGGRHHPHAARQRGPGVSRPPSRRRGAQARVTETGSGILISLLQKTLMYENARSSSRQHRPHFLKKKSRGIASTASVPTDPTHTDTNFTNNRGFRRS